MKKFILLVLTLLTFLSYSQEDFMRKDIQILLESTLYVREATGNNDGIEVEEYLAEVGLGPGYPWCAAYTTWGLNQCNIPNPQSAWSPDWAKTSDIVWSQKLLKERKAKSPQIGDTFTIYYTNLKRVGHVGFFLRETNGYFITIEGNTNDGGSRLGIGVFKRKRDARKIYAVTNYITPYLAY